MGILAVWTWPHEDWLLGLEYIPVVEMEGIEFVGSIFSIGLFLFRIDFLIK